MSEQPILEPVADAPLSVVLLAWQTESALEEGLTGWAKMLRTRSRKRRGGPADEIVLVDDGRVAETEAIVQRLGESYAPVVWQRHVVADGVGRMLGTGLSQATRPLLFYAPCRSVCGPEVLGKLLATINAVHFVSGYRAGRAMPAPLRLLGVLVRWGLGIGLGIWPAPLPGWLGWRGHAARWAARFFFGVHNSDVGCPVRLVRREVLERAPIQSRTSFAHVELLAKLNFQGCLFAEDVPLVLSPGEEGLPTDPLGARMRDALRLFTRPNFGPPILPVAAPVEGAAPASTEFFTSR